MAKMVHQMATDIKDKYGRVDDHYEIVDYRVIPRYRTSDKMLFPRMGHNDENRKALYKLWMDNKSGTPSMGDNIVFFFRYQLGWMYWRYFLWNFSGRQNDTQGHGDLLDGNWISGINFIDSERLGPQEFVPQSITGNKGYNKYFMLPLLLGLIGLIFQLARAPKDFTVVMFDHDASICVFK